MKEEYTVKLTEDEVKSLIHGFGLCRGFSPQVHEVYYCSKSLFEEYVFKSDDCKSGDLVFYYQGRKP
jgi:hypothetical protein